MFLSIMVHNLKRDGKEIFPHVRLETNGEKDDELYIYVNDVIAVIPLTEVKKIARVFLNAVS